MARRTLPQVIPWPAPYNGVIRSTALYDQPARSAINALNTRNRDPKDWRLRMCRRAGLSKWVADPVESEDFEVQDLAFLNLNVNPAGVDLTIPGEPGTDDPLGDPPGGFPPGDPIPDPDIPESEGEDSESPESETPAESSDEIELTPSDLPTESSSEDDLSSLTSSSLTTTSSSEPVSELSTSTSETSSSEDIGPDVCAEADCDQYPTMTITIEATTTDGGTCVGLSLLAELAQDPTKSCRWMFSAAGEPTITLECFEDGEDSGFWVLDVQSNGNRLSARRVVADGTFGDYVNPPTAGGGITLNDCNWSVVTLEVGA